MVSVQMICIYMVSIDRLSKNREEEEEDENEQH